MSTATPVKERPILFSAPMVRAILAGRKTQTRRVMKEQPPKCEGRWSFIASSTEAGESGRFRYSWADANGSAFTSRGRESGVSFRCPYGSVGDRLWVRESWNCLKAGTSQPIPPSPRPNVCSIAFAATEHLRRQDDPSCELVTRWRPSIHMPRWASRITLEITGVRVERLQSISKGDARSEGMEKIGFSETAIEEPGGTPMVDVGCWKNYEDDSHPFCGLMPERSFQSLWNVINGHESWKSNPWVWVVEFKRIEEARC